MFCLIPNEKKTLLFIIFLILVGSFLRFSSANTQKKEYLVAKGEAQNPKKNIFNINKASEQELELIPGIGSVIARRILAYRSDQGPFKDLDGLTNVKGIGDKKIEAIKDYITF